MQIHESLNDRVGMAGDYTRIGLVHCCMRNYKEALGYHGKARAIDEELNDRVGMAVDYTDIGNIMLKIGDNKEALKSLYNALRIFQELEKKTGYHYPRIEDIQGQISYLKQYDK